MLTLKQADWLIQTNWQVIGRAIPKLKEKLSKFPGFIHLDFISADLLLADEFLDVQKHTHRQLIESSLSAHELILTIDKHPALGSSDIHQLSKIFFPLRHQAEGRWVSRNVEKRAKLKPEQNVILVFTYADGERMLMVAVSIHSLLSQSLKQVVAA